MAGGQASATAEPPRLAFIKDETDIASGRTRLVISWSFPSDGFVLESATTLSPPDWKPAAEPPIAVDNRWEVRMPLDQVQRYFRLRKP